MACQSEESMTPVEIARAFNERGVPIVDPDEYEAAVPARVEDVDELSDLDYHGQFERFTS